MNDAAAAFRLLLVVIVACVVIGVAYVIVYRITGDSLLAFLAGVLVLLAVGFGGVRLWPRR